MGLASSRTNPCSRKCQIWAYCACVYCIYGHSSLVCTKCAYPVYIRISSLLCAYMCVFHSFQQGPPLPNIPKQSIFCVYGHVCTVYTYIAHLCTLSVHPDYVCIVCIMCILCVYVHVYPYILCTMSTYTTPQSPLRSWLLRIWAAFMSKLGHIWVFRGG